mmetsp:Transcript_6037/g.18746  ORF Transcript_6037/g.18746 Transcript_6037/m.18746 type:complete len:263 (+) Transcript_6037:188-976(+)
MAFRWCRCSSVERMLLMEPGTALELLDVAGLLRQASRRMSCTLTDLLEKVGELLSPSSRPPRSRLSVATSMAMSEVSASSCSLRSLPSSSTSLSSSLRTGDLASKASRISSASSTASLVSAQRCRPMWSLNRTSWVLDIMHSASTALQTSSNFCTRCEWPASCSRSAMSSSRRACTSRLPEMERPKGHQAGGRGCDADPSLALAASLLACTVSACSRASASPRDARSSRASLASSARHCSSSRSCCCSPSRAMRSVATSEPT